jgi:Zn finger protein HypA/HybF involved in hydrogenase expression
LVYCSNCGEKIDDNANFCPKCGTKTPKGRASHATYPADLLIDAFYNVGAELEKAFNTAARETNAAFQKARENLQQKPGERQTVACLKCSSKNPAGSIFCYNCGARIAPVGESHGGA